MRAPSAADAAWAPSAEARRLLARRLRAIREAEPPSLASLGPARPPPRRLATPEPPPRRPRPRARSVLAMRAALARGPAPAPPAAEVQRLALGAPAERPRWGARAAPRAPRRSYSRVEYVAATSVLRYNSDEELQLFSVLVGARDNGFALAALGAKCAQLAAAAEQLEQRAAALAAQAARVSSEAREAALVYRAALASNAIGL